MKAPLVIPPGIVSDDTTFATEGRYSDGNNMRPWRGSMQTIGGWSMLVDGVDGICRNVISWVDIDGVPTVVFGTNTKLQVYAGGTLSDITPTSGFTAGAEHGAGGPGWSAGDYDEGDYGEASLDNYFALTWSLANWGENLLAAPRMQTLFVWENDPGTEATAIANAPDNIVYMLVTPQRQVMALGCNEEVSTNFNPMCIRWCDFEDYTDWTTSSANNAGEYILPGSGRIVTARMVGDYIAIWTDSSLFMGEYIGDASETYRFTRVSGGCGLAGPNAAQVVGQTAYWITPDYQFYAWQPGAQPVLLPCPIRNDFKDNTVATQPEKIAATSVGAYGEVWWFYADGRDGIECSRYVALSTVAANGESAWFRGQMERSAAVDAGPAQYPIFVTPDGTAYWHEIGNTADGGALEWSLRTADSYVEEGGRNVQLRGLWPDFEDQQGAVSLRLYLRAYPQDSTVHEKGPYSLTVNKRRADFLCSARVISAEFSGNSAPAFVRFGKPVFDAVLRGLE